MITLSKEQTKRLHKILLDSTGGLDGIRDETLNDSALAAPFQTFDSVCIHRWLLRLPGQPILLSAIILLWTARQ